MLHRSWSVGQHTSASMVSVPLLAASAFASACVSVCADSDKLPVALVEGLEVGESGSAASPPSLPASEPDASSWLQCDVGLRIEQQAAGCLLAGAIMTRPEQSMSLQHGLGQADWDLGAGADL